MDHAQSLFKKQSFDEEILYNYRPASNLQSSTCKLHDRKRAALSDRPNWLPRHSNSPPNPHQSGFTKYR